MTVDFTAMGVWGTNSTSLRSMARERGCAPEASRDTVLLSPGRMEGEGARGGTSFDAGEVGADDTADVAVVDMDTFDPADDVE